MHSEFYYISKCALDGRIDGGGILVAVANSNNASVTDLLLCFKSFENLVVRTVLDMLPKFPSGRRSCSDFKKFLIDYKILD